MTELRKRHPAGGLGLEVASLAGPLSYLRPPGIGDVSVLYRWATDPTAGPRWRYRGRVPSVEHFAREMEMGVLAHFVLERRSPPGPFAYLVAYNPDMNSGVTRASLLAEPGAWKSEELLSGTELFIDYLFATFQLRKLYVDTLDFAVDSSLAGMFEGLAELECRLRAHEFCSGGYRDLLTFAIWRETWDAGRTRTASKVDAPGTTEGRPRSLLSVARGSVRASDGSNRATGLGIGASTTLDDDVLLLTDKRVKLRPVLPEDSAFLYSLVIDQATGVRWRTRGVVPSFEVFVREFWVDVLTQFVVEDIRSGAPVGQVVAYGADLANGWAYLGVAVPAALMRTGIGIRAANLFVNYLFSTWNFRKLYAETPHYNYSAVSSAEGSGFELEGHLREHSYYDGQFHDLCLVALYREAWEANRLPGSERPKPESRTGRSFQAARG